MTMEGPQAERLGSGARISDTGQDLALDLVDDREVDARREAVL